LICLTVNVFVRAVPIDTSVVVAPEKDVPALESCNVYDAGALYPKSAAVHVKVSAVFASFACESVKVVELAVSVGLAPTARTAFVSSFLQDHNVVAAKTIASVIFNIDFITTVLVD
jgi:hypothetical protein